ncbi:MAG: hypothetical protein JKP98_05095 [Rhodobacteraceae bacterium]|nr:hypothetical protein [Paracoccaceae bacterium]
MEPQARTRSTPRRPPPSSSADDPATLIAAAEALTNPPEFEALSTLLGASRWRSSILCPNGRSSRGSNPRPVSACRS